MCSSQQCPVVLLVLLSSHMTTSSYISCTILSTVNGVSYVSSLRFTAACVHSRGNRYPHPCCPRVQEEDDEEEAGVGSADFDPYAGVPQPFPGHSAPFAPSPSTPLHPLDDPSVACCVEREVVSILFVCYRYLLIHAHLVYIGLMSIPGMACLKCAWTTANGTQADAVMPHGSLVRDW